MKIRAAAAFVLVVGLFLGLATAGESGWLTNLDEGVKVAKKEKKVVLVDFTGSDWCGWCIKLKKEVFDTDEFKAWAEKKAVLVELDFPKSKPQDEETKKTNREHQKKYGIRGFPTIVVLDGEGKEIGRLGYVKGGPAEWIKKAESVIEGGDKGAAK